MQHGLDVSFAVAGGQCQPAAHDFRRAPTHSVEQMVASAWTATPRVDASGLGARANPRYRRSMAPSGTPSVGRIPIVNVQPTLEQGRWAIRAVVGESIPITATIFREGHDAEGATIVVTDPSGKATSLPMPLAEWGLSLYRGHFVPTLEGS